ncbi:MBL fold metallo-hydrolase [Streptomyces sp. NBC_01089]|uniref:MBL fold metallo-hydrolase n=1 Tax=Streptomyces sp. NBC_01089 TaxID=2903747 RepID=UPI003868E93E|nr:MBL fold metallo-hydrolase [Streptomyces sp. NBC_01089]
MELILLGTAGGPQPNSDRSAPAQALVHRGEIIVVDCGSGVARQLTRAGLALRDLRTVLITHQHIDHTADYGNLVLLAWTAGLSDPVRAYGPPPLKAVTADYLAMTRTDVRHREALGRPPLSGLFDVREVTGPGVLRDADGLRITAALAEHPPMTPSFAYRFDTAERSVVISGDTAASDRVAELAAGADILVHEAYSPDDLHLLLRHSNARLDQMRAHFARAHTTAEEAGRIAARSGVGTLVLSHIIPTTGIDPDVLRRQAGRSFDGEIIVGSDLDRL